MAVINNCDVMSGRVTVDTMTDPEFPQYSRSELLADGIVHVLSISAAIVGVVVLFLFAAGSLPAASFASVAVYSVGLVAVFCVSAAYNMVGISPLKELLRRFDQATIYFKIASTYTPFMAVKLAGWTGGGFLALVWSLATFGMTTKLFFPEPAQKDILRALPGAWMVCRVDLPAVVGRSVDPHPSAACRRRSALHNRRSVPRLGRTSLPERHLACICPWRSRLPLCSHHGFRGACVEADQARICRPRALAALSGNQIHAGEQQRHAGKFTQPNPSRFHAECADMVVKQRGDQLSADDGRNE